MKNLLTIIALSLPVFASAVEFPCSTITVLPYTIETLEKSKAPSAPAALAKMRDQLATATAECNAEKAERQRVQAKLDQERDAYFKAEAERQAEEAAERARLKALPGVKIGMTAKQVLEGTSWGKPETINRTTTKRGVDEQWVYDGRNYLYFTNGKLTAIQN